VPDGDGRLGKWLQHVVWSLCSSTVISLHPCCLSPTHPPIHPPVPVLSCPLIHTPLPATPLHPTGQH
jgi:hypothetical protein